MSANKEQKMTTSQSHNSNKIERKPQSDYYRVIVKGVTVEFLSTLMDKPE